MPSIRLNRVRAHIAANNYSSQPVAEKRRRNGTILKAATDKTNDPKLHAVAKNRQNAEKRRKRDLSFRKPTRPTSSTPRPSSISADRHVYARGDLNAYDYYQLKSGMKSAARQEKNQSGFPDALRHPTTINLGICSLDADLTAQFNLQRPRLRRAMCGLTEGHRVDGAFQVEFEDADKLADMFPEEEWPDGFDPILDPKKKWALLHIHCVVCDPSLTKNSVRQLLKKAYPGKNRVCIRRVLPVFTMDDGTKTGGAQGFLEYARIERSRGKGKGAKEVVEAVIEFAKMNSTWSGKSKGFSRGKRIKKSSVVIDQERVKYVEAQDRMQWVKDKWNELSYAERFIHCWFSGAIGLMKSENAWIKAFGSGALSVKFMLRLCTNWVHAEFAEDVDFSTFLKAPIRE